MHFSACIGTSLPKLLIQQKSVCLDNMSLAASYYIRSEIGCQLLCLCNCLLSSQSVQQCPVRWLVLSRSAFDRQLAGRE